jgi:hypothetical protein
MEPYPTDTATPPPAQVTRVFTFGYGHVCPYTGVPLAEHYAIITAPDAKQCRDLMLGLFGKQWSHEYASVDAATRGGRFPMVEHARIVVCPSETSGFGGASPAPDPEPPGPPA